MKKNFVLPVLAAVAAVALVFTGCNPDDPEPVKVSSITVSPLTATLEIDETVTLSAVVAPANAENATYTWSSSDETKATVTSAGVVTAKGAGEVIITATANDGSNVKGSATITVSPVPVVPTVAIAFAENLSLAEVNTFDYSEIVDEEGAPVEDLSVVVSTPGSIGKITLKLTTDVEVINAALTGMEIADGFELGALEAESPVAVALATFFGEGLPTGDDVVGKESVKLDFSAIQSLIAGTPIMGGVNQFDIEIKAEDEDSEILSATQTLKLKFVDDVTVWGTIAGDEFDIDEEQVINKSEAAGEARKINIESLTGIEKLLVDIENPAIDAMIGEGGFPELDLATPGEAGTALLATLAQMQLTLPSGDDVKGKTELSLNLASNFVAQLVELGEGTTGIKLTVEDAAGHAVTKTLTITIVDDLTLTIESDAIGDEPLEILKSEATGETPTPVVVDVVADQGIKNFTVKIESTSATFMGMLALQEIPAEFDLANAPAALAAVLTEMGLLDPENPILDATEVQFDITSFIPAIFLAMEGAPAEDPGKTECTANFTITVKDGADQSKAATIALSLVDDTEAPETGEEEGEEE